MSNEWYTPRVYIEAAREVMGTIDLDPASCALANETVQATTYYSIEDDGLSKEWDGNTFLNPPYHKPAFWIKKFLTVKQGILLVCPFTDTLWFQPLWNCPMCFTKGRIPFHNGQKAHSNGYGSVFVYIGSNEQKFRDVFSQFGHVVMPERVVV